MKLLEPFRSGTAVFGETVAVCFVCLALIGCGPTATTPSSTPSGTAPDLGASELTEIEGAVAIDGSSTVAPISEAAAEAFGKTFKNVRVTVAISGTGGGFGRFTNGEIDISDASRPIKDSEFKACQAKGVSFVELPIAYDGLSIVINKDNDFVDQLTIDELKKIFLREGGAKSWKEVNPAWPDVAIKIYAPGTDSGTFDYFFGDVVAKDSDNEHPRDDMSVSEDDNVLVTGIAGEKGAIGFFGASYYFANVDKIKAVKIVDPKTGEAVGPTPETIESGQYAPFSRPLFIYVNTDSMKRPEVKAFLKFYLKEAGKLAEMVDYVALPPSIYEVVQTHYEERITGTHYLTEALEKRTGPLAELYTTESVVDIE
ncbi:Phosphate-binding protein PstS precursor [Novipirellula galeiformis]|uniref:Phosphate-binding protein n=1 Tax=Novipirellula galeiformis TaxID=2528004 RepID=A0A5C6CI69_9BACT|nr:PstS family phosphate ABC transporter substrate-binding protein [Novipirellula galeiformis]TWU23194.1 Phosphate-binding protein PstS precursor [Novipirellula galeiformis]